MKNQPSGEQPSQNSNGSGSAYHNQDDQVLQKFEDDDDFLISDDMDLDEDVKNISDTNMFGVVDASITGDSANQKTVTSNESNLFERTISDSEEKANQQNNNDPDESWALNLLKNLDDEDEDEEPIIKKPEKTQHSASRTKPKNNISQVNGRVRPEPDPKPKTAKASKLNGSAHSAPNKSAHNKNLLKPTQPRTAAAARRANTLAKQPVAKKAAATDYPDYSSIHEYDGKKPAETKKSRAQKNKKPVEKPDSSIFQLSEDAEPEIETRAEPKLDYKQSFENIDLEISEDAYPALDQSFGSSINSTYTDAIEPEPVEFPYGNRHSFWKNNLPLIAGVVFASLLLLAQILWLNLGQLSRVEPYRSYYASLCEIVGCTLPTIVDRSKIRAANLVVRSHPTIANALIVDAVLQNSAAFPQSFPDLDLIFTDVKDKPIAARRFTPQEYLGGELAGSIEMPAGNPVHIAVEIADPGLKAVGYRMSIAN